MVLAAGAHLGSYEIVAPLGEGGMGEVYEAIDPTLDRHIAVKVLAERLAHDADALRRFQREVRAVAALNHPNIVTIHTVEEADGVHFLTMELVDGKSLDQLVVVVDEPMPLGRFFDVAIALADALAAAHTRGITHRDLKSANVMVTADGRVKVLDFGLAKVGGTATDLVATVTQGAVLLTADGVVVGTFPYMSPEQVETKPVDHRSDIFSLGIIMFELLTGRRPFGRDSAPALMSAILRDVPPSVWSVRAEPPDSVATPIRRCVEKAPASRYQTAAELQRDLRLVQVRHISDASPGPVAAETEKSIAVLPFTNMSAAPETEFFSDGIAEEIINALSQIDDLHVAARTSAFSFKGKNVDLREVGEKLNVATVLEGSVRKAGNRLQITTQLVNVADGYQFWSERYDRELDDTLAEAHNALGGAALMHDFDFALAEREFLRALELNPGFIQACAWYALFYGSMIRGRVDEAVEHTTDMVTRDPLSGYAWGVHAFARIGADRHGEAVDAALEAVARDPTSFIANWGLQNAYEAVSRFPEAVATGHATLALSARHPWALAVLASTFCDWNKRLDARAVHDELTERATHDYVQPGILAWSAAAAGLDAEAGRQAEQAVAERDPSLVLFLNYWPPLAVLRQALREVGKLDDIRHRLGLTWDLKGDTS